MSASPATFSIHPAPISLHAQANCMIVIPTYNERENIGALISQIVETAGFNVLVVDDNSPDGAGEVVAELARRYPRLGC